MRTIEQPDSFKADFAAGDGQQVQAQPTPGPWVLIEDANWPFNPRVESAGGSVIVSESRMAYSSEQKTLRQVMDGAHMGKDRAEAARLNALQMANLRLIAAAPDLLAALQCAEQYLAKRLCNTGGEGETQVLPLIRAALTRALK